MGKFIPKQSRKQALKQEEDPYYHVLRDVRIKVAVTVKPYRFFINKGSQVTVV